MKTYVGTKIIKAIPMDKQTFLKEVKNEDFDSAGTENEHGYHVKYPDGYDSWSPKTVFEEAYRLVSADEKILMSDSDTETEG